MGGVTGSVRLTNSEIYDEEKIEDFCRNQDQLNIFETFSSQVLDLI